MKVKRILSVCLALTMVLALIGCGKTPSSTAPSKPAAEAKAWAPDRDFNIRVPFAAGGVSDIIARIVGQGLQKTYGKTVIVNNMTGANGAIAANDLLNKPASATELMTGGIAMFTLAPLFNKDFKMKLDDFKFVAGMISEDFILVVNPAKSGVKSWKDFVEYSKNKRILFGSNTPGGATHMLATALLGEAGIKAEAVTSDGSNKDVLALLSGNVDCAIATVSVVQQHVDAGTILPIAVFSADAYTGFKGQTVPTVKSFGYDIVFRSSNFLMTRAGVNQAAVDHIYNSIQAYYKTDEFREAAKKANYTPDTSDGTTVRKTIENAADLCKKVYDKYYAK